MAGSRLTGISIRHKIRRQPVTGPHADMDRSQDKTVVLTPRSSGGGGGGPLLGNALPNGYVLQGRYVIEKQLGAGGFGITYLAKHRYLEDIWVAIKEYLPEGAAVRDETSRVHPISSQHDKIYSWGLHRFLDEARLLRQFQHPNIVSVEDFFEANDTAYLVMNYIRGRSIQTELDNGREFNEDELRHIIYQLLDALNRIHRDGLFHRDISPDNILLREEDDSPVLIDFGSARYEMRMHGADSADTEQGHSPTTIFKQGYSPVEQYEGTKQGPYTDIYALAATLYRVAFGTRPVDSLKRSGEMRLTHRDPLMPASERGADRFSADFLETIDAALKIDPAERPQSIDQWLAHLNDHGVATAVRPTAQPEQRANRRWPGLLLAAILGGAGAAGAYFWYAQQQPDVVQAGDIPDMLAEANREFAAGAFDTARQARARDLYVRVLSLDGFNDHALAGLSAANLMKEFDDALTEEDRAEAVVKLDKIEAEFRRAGIDIGKLDTGWKRLERLSKQQALRDLLPRMPLSPQTWDEARRLLTDIRALPGGGALADHGEQALAALRATADAIGNQDFADARRRLSEALPPLENLGIAGLPDAEATIDEQQRSFEVQRRARIDGLLEGADRSLTATPLTREGIEQALAQIDEVLALEVAHSGALARSRLMGKMLEAYDQIESGDFGSGRATLASARKIASNAGFDTGPVDRAQAFLAEREYDWNIARTREALGERLGEAARLLDTGPLDGEAGERAMKLYRDALSLGGEDSAFAAENETAAQGIRLADLLDRIRASLRQHEYEAARVRLAEPAAADWTRGAGLGPAWLGQVGEQVAQAELAWHLGQVSTQLRELDPLAESALSDVRWHVARILALRPQNPNGLALSGALAALDNHAEARAARDYPRANAQLRQFIEQLSAAGIDNPALQDSLAQLGDEASAWASEQHELRIADMLRQAFGVLREAPLAAENHAAAARVFEAIASIDADQDRGARGLAILEALGDAREALDEARFGQADEAIARADEALAGFGEAPLSEARNTLQRRHQAWLDGQETMRLAQLADASAAMRDRVLDDGMLQGLREAFATIAGLHQGDRIAAAGQELVGQLEQALAALRLQSYPEAGQWLDKAVAQLPAVGLEADLLDRARRDSAQAAEQYATDLRAAELDTLLAQAAEQIQQAPLDDASAPLASDLFSRAIELDKALPESRSRTPRITAGLEAVFMLRAFAAELADGQFDAMRQTVLQLEALLPKAGLDAGLVETLNGVALNAEVDARIAKVRAFLEQGDWPRQRDFAPASTQLDAIEAMSPGHPAATPWGELLGQLQLVFRQRAARRFDEALSALASADAGMQELALDNASLASLREEIGQERARWQTLSKERDLITWTGQAVAALDREPFAEQTWSTVESLVARILQARSDDERGLALRRALDAVRHAETLLAANNAQGSRTALLDARSALEQIGLAYALDRGLATVDERLNRAHAGHMQTATALLDSGVIDDTRIEQAQTALRQVLDQAPDHPVARTALETLGAISDARRAGIDTRYAEAERILAQASERIGGETSNADPLPAVRSLLQETRQRLARHRPSPAEIYPIISVGLRKIGSAPLDADSLGAAEDLLRNALGLQADEPSAIGALAAIAHLRDTRRLMDAGDIPGASGALAQAEQVLQDMGLSPSMLQAARNQIEAR